MSMLQNFLGGNLEHRQIEKQFVRMPEDAQK